MKKKYDPETMHQRVLGPALLASIVAFALAPLACSSGGAGVPAIVTTPPFGIIEGGVDADSAVPLEDGAIAADTSTGDAAPIDLECTDKILNGNETDVDCGGPKCPRCLDGKKCVAATDCSGNFCELTTRQCSTPTCLDKIKNGAETDTDCGGGVCGTCGVGRGCKLDTDCATAKCDVVANACACPPRMITVSKAVGGAYCMDETEVTNGDYDRFIRANVPATAVQQPPACATNTTYTPAPSPDPAVLDRNSYWPPAQPLSTSLGLPVRNVDWCDAVAYCKWAGKVLCGDVSGQPGLVADRNDASKNAWFNACSAQGTLDFAYGSAYRNDRCYDSGGASPFTGPGPVSDWTDQGAYVGIPVVATRIRTCHGGAVGLFQASGNVGEWENTCQGTTDTSACLVRGGAYDDTLTTSLQCNAVRELPRLARRPNVGIRCCQF